MNYSNVISRYTTNYGLCKKLDSLIRRTCTTDNGGIFLYINEHWVYIKLLAKRVTGKITLY